ncbi:hypothetical protein [Primorskyibacter sp. S187A]|uniref:hypothetical protein n=1 Tax=Primorskyibacter sp. S187A TaxID=3415130 RepID=UPI003C7C245A
MCCLHSVELCLNAYLRHKGVSAGQIRARLHNVFDPEFAHDLRLRKKTARHLLCVSTSREYLMTRYAPERLADMSQMNRMTATAEEVLKKTGKHLGIEA